MTSERLPHGGNDEVSLLDVAVVIAENWLLVTLSAFIAGAIALGVVLGTAQTSYKADVQLIVDAETAPLLRSEAIRGYAVAKPAPDVDRSAWNDTVDTLNIEQIANTDAYGLSLRSSDDLLARAALEAVIQGVLFTAGPPSGRLAEIEREIERVTSRLALIDRKVTEVASNQDTGEAGDPSQLSSDAFALVALLDSQHYHQSLLDSLNLEKLGRITKENILGDVTVVPLQDKRRFVIPVAVAFAVAIGALIFVFMRESFKNATGDPVQAEKLRRIRQAFWRK